jgi:hypothetical protein
MTEKWMNNQFGYYKSQSDQGAGKAEEYRQSGPKAQLPLPPAC